MAVYNRFEISNYASEAKERWGDTTAWREYEKKAADGTPAQRGNAADGLMRLFAEIGTLKSLPPSDPAVQNVIDRLQRFITDHYYTCSDEMLSGLGKLYVCDPRFTKNIDDVGGEGTARFAAEAIKVRCRKKQS